MSGATEIDELPSLSELLSPAALEQICRSFVELHDLGVAFVDTSGRKLAQAHVTTAEPCGHLCGAEPTSAACAAVQARLLTCELAERGGALEAACESGLRFTMLPIWYEGTLLGRAILGPWRSLERSVASPPREQVERLGPDATTLAPAAMLGLSDSTVAKVVETLRQVLDVLIHSGHKLYMTSRLHLASISAAFSDLQKSNRELKEANERLAELERLKSNFVATISHELRTPLTSVIGYSEMLLEGMAGPLNPEQREYVSTILEKGESLLSLIGQVLDLSRIESGNVTIHRQLAHPRELILLAASDVAPQARKRGLELSIEISEAVQPISVDLDKLRRVVTNLLGNAVKFTPSGGRITLRADVALDLPVGDSRFDLFDRERNRFLVLEVSDTGVGIPEDKLHRVFDAFFQVDSSSTREYGGTGLGLALVRNFVTAHGGRVEARSRVGVGSTFTVKLPYSPNVPIELDGSDLRGKQPSPFDLA